MRRPEVRELRWRDPPLAEIATPKSRLKLTVSVGSGLSRRPGDPPGRVWGLGDRGPNLKVPLAVDRYGLDHLAPLREVAGAKVLPLAGFQPAIFELSVGEHRVELERTLPLAAASGPLSGRPIPGGAAAGMEPAVDLAGQPLPADPDGVDPEGLAALADGGFWVSEEYGPSLLRVDPAGQVLARWVPPGRDLPGATAALPSAALQRRLNRGFEGLAVSGDDRWLYVAFQSALEGASPMSTLIWQLEARDGTLVGAFAYPFDPPETFTADAREGRVGPQDLKVCDLAWVGPDRLIVLERMRLSARLYRVDLAGPQPLAKTRLFSTDDHAEVAPDLEGVAVLTDREVLIATDNDFGTEGAETRFYRLRYDEPL